MPVTTRALEPPLVARCEIRFVPLVPNAISLRHEPSHDTSDTQAIALSGHEREPVANSHRSS